MKFLTTTLVAGLAAGSAHAATIDFEGFARGADVNQVVTGGVSVDITTIANAGGLNQAIAFDTTDAGSFADGDPDLAGPFTNASGGTLNPGNILVIAEAPGTDSGADTNPDDNGNGGVITFNFSKAIDFLGFDVFDDVTNFSVRADGAEVATASLDNDNEFLSFDLNVVGVTQLVFDFGNSSGGIDNIDFAISAVPVPATLPLMLAGFAALGYVGRRKAS